MQVNSNLAASSPPTKIGNLNLRNIINWPGYMFKI